MSVVLLLLGLLGCARTTVHMHAAELSKDVRDKVKTDLEAKGFKVALRDNEYPFTENAVLYFPHEGIEEDLDAIDEVLNENGLAANHRFTIYKDRIGKHVYTAGNVGLYLLPEEVKRSSGKTSRVRSEFPIDETDAEFISSNCNVEYVYELLEGDRALLSDFNLPAGKSTLARATWRVSDNSVIIVSDGEEFRYRKSTFHREHASQFSDYNVSYHIALEPEEYYRIPFGCAYKSTFTESF
ncbi:hypothetical protein SCD92_00400 [Gilvimarinus sp. SDUM040013]|uniref:Lipoprotein n=1 Tax=Gilvimarinus gilvus TaxID=3058038 RepID=A0ABU4RUC5_9GAMM|nr:hypothetical protein [Gilvimarinus sp. SDUM040013]MDX6847796.1 hypothetical protein [Gilvimarinus sp. SDUM040013]